MRVSVVVFLLLGSWLPVVSQTDTNHAITYEEGIARFSAFANQYEKATLFTYGITDIGKPLHVLTYGEGIKSLEDLANDQKACILINNAIHAGEACGTQASINLLEWLIEQDLSNINIAIIPFYNISGVLHRSPYNRTDQFGPDTFGFRANYQNLDLNRDFIKMDSKNTTSLVQLFHKIDPEIYIETHTTNGSEHQNVLGLLFSQYDKMEEPIRAVAYHQLDPYLYKKAQKEGMRFSPYVYTRSTPDKGLYAFYDSPRYSTGFVDLFQTIGLITEAHKYKSYPNRVKHTHALLRYVVTFAQKNNEALLSAKLKARQAIKAKSAYPILWELDTSRLQVIPFTGYESETAISKVTQDSFLRYDKTKPFTMDVPYYKFMKPALSAKKPAYFVIPQYNQQLIDRLIANNVDIQVLNRDTTFTGGLFVIKDYQTVSSPYEKHYLHYNIKAKEVERTRRYFAGDLLISTDQKGVRYLMETLDPRGKDSFFAWNFFDEILQQKEYFSSFAFDTTAFKLLQENEQLKQSFLEWRGKDPKNFPSHYEQLKWIYRHSPYYEENHLTYPVMKLYK